jgi:tetratricopeptide (TPR) repeat protein
MANNAGFALYKLGKYEDAVQWFQKAIGIDANRAVAYLNLGDAYAMLQRKQEARQAFEKYLELAPNGRSAASVKEKLRALEPTPAEHP